MVTAGIWFVLTRVSGDDKPRAEARLDMMRKRRAGQAAAGGVDDTQQTKNEALTAYFEKATTPLADKVSGNEKEMGAAPREAHECGFPTRIGTHRFQDDSTGLRRGRPFHWQHLRLLF